MRTLRRSSSSPHILKFLTIEPIFRLQQESWLWRFFPPVTRLFWFFLERLPFIIFTNCELILPSCVGLIDRRLIGWFVALANIFTRVLSVCSSIHHKSAITPKRKQEHVHEAFWLSGIPARAALFPGTNPFNILCRCVFHHQIYKLTAIGFCRA